MPAHHRPDPIRWLVCGHHARIDWSALDGLFTATLPALPGVRARGRSRTEVLRRLYTQLQPGQPQPES